jgi:osmoprotectant transport system permease protein
MALAADFILGWVERALAPGPSRAAGKGRRWALGTAAVIILGGLVFLIRGARLNASRPVVVGSKDFTEQVLLGEIIAQAIESSAGIKVERRMELGGDLCHRAMLSGQIDGYVEYTGTAYTSILKHDVVTDPREVYNRVKKEYASRWNIEWLDPLGFNNTFAILVRGQDARRLNLRTISSVAPYAPLWRAGFGQEFMSRPDGYPGFVRTYGLNFAGPPREMDLALTYRALAAGQVDLIAGNSTDGLIDKLGLFQLEDDRRYFPPYEAVPVVRRDVLSRYPQISDAVKGLAGKLSSAQMRRLNYAVDAEHRDVKQVVREFLAGQAG